MNWAWQDRAACRGEDLSLFFGHDGERQPEREIRERKAKEICRTCPVENTCLDFAVETDQRGGVWGGLNQDERAKERKRARRRESWHRSKGKAA